jgi:hypothetical protein
MKSNIFLNLRSLAVTAGLFCSIVNSAAGEDLSGKWTSIVEGFGGQANTGSLTLSQDGGSLKGSHEDGFGESEIEDGKAGESSVSFKITREFGERKMVATFSGKAEGKAITGIMTIVGRDGPREMKWEAYRTPEIDPTGLWKWKTASGRDGAERSSWVKLKYAKGELTGTYRTERGEMAITEPVLEGKTISFKIERGFGDRVFATEYKGTLDNKMIKGSIQSRRGDEERKTEWSASREIPTADPVGTWTWTTRWRRDGEGFESKLTIKKEGDALSGSHTGRDGETPIEKVKLEGNILSFEFTTENDRGSFTSSFSGEIDGDTFEPVIATKFGEREMKRSITATRVLPAAEPVGTWKWTNRRRRNGEESESILALKKSDDGQLSGTLTRGDSESPIKEVKLEGNVISFTTERSWRDNSVTIRYQGTIRGDEIKGTTRMGGPDNSAGDWASFWSAMRSK